MGHDSQATMDRMTPVPYPATLPDNSNLSGKLAGLDLRGSAFGHGSSQTRRPAPHPLIAPAGVRRGSGKWRGTSRWATCSWLRRRGRRWSRSRLESSTGTPRGGAPALRGRTRCGVTPPRPEPGAASFRRRLSSRRLELDPDGLRLEVGVEVGATLLAADARCLVAAEWGGRVAAAPGVDVDVASLEHRGQLMGVGDVAGPQARGEAVLGVVCAAGDLLQVVEGHRDQDGAEDLLAGDPHRVLDADEERRLDEVAAAVGAVGRSPRGDLGALLDARVDVALDAVELLLGDEGAELGAGVEARADLCLAGVVGQALGHFVEEVALDEQARAGVAGLAGVEVDALVGALDRAVEVCVGEDD